MKKFLFVSALLLPLVGLRAQDIKVISVKNLAPVFGVPSRFLDDTAAVARYLDSLPDNNQLLTDTCVSLNARVLAFQNTMLYDYKHKGDTVWVNATTCLNDYDFFRQRLNDLSAFVLRKAHSYIEQEHYRKEYIQQTAFNQRKDTIARLHRTIINACEGFGVSDADRKKELKDIYYAYLSVYNRYDLSKDNVTESYLEELDRFVEFQNHLITNLLGSSSYRNRIKNFYNTLKIRCGHAHNDVLRSYQRISAIPTAQVKFSSIDSYYDYIDSLKGVIHVQECYLSVVDLREKIAANSERISNLYGARFRQVVKTYQEVAASINTIPTFSTQSHADAFIGQMKEFVEVQESYIRDYNRLALIREHGDSIDARCSIRYSDVSKAYTRMVNELYNKSETPKPAYRSVDDAARFSLELDYCETLQRQYDTIIELRKEIDRLKDSVAKGWMGHMMIYNGLQTIRKQMVLTPSFISTVDGSRFIAELRDFLDTEEKCVLTVRRYYEYRRLDNVLATVLQPYRNIRKAYSRLEKAYITIKAINHTSEVYVYCRQLESFISVQTELLEKANTSEINSIDFRLDNIADIDKIEKIIGL